MRRLIFPALVALVLLPTGSAGAFGQGSLVNASGPLGLPGLGQLIPSTAGDSSLGAGGSTVSADGRYVVFTSSSDALLTPEQAATTSIAVFRRDTQLNTTQLVSLAPDGTPINDPNLAAPTISGDGNRVAFHTRAALTAADTNGEPDLYFRDLAVGSTLLASRKLGGGVGNGRVDEGSISGSGNFVTYATDATDMVPGDTNAHDDAFRTCIGQLCIPPTTIRVSVATGGGQLGPGCFVARPTISESGARIAFETSCSDADGPGGADNDSASDIYVYDVPGNTTELVSRADGVAGAKASSSSNFARISAEGDRISFSSSAGELDGAVEGMGDLDKDIFVRDTTTDMTTRATLTSSDVQLNGDAGGSFVQLVADKVLVAFNHASGSFVRNVTDGTLTAPLLSAGTGGFGGLAANAETTVATAQDPGLSPDDDDDFFNVYVRPTLGEGFRLVSRATGSGPLPRGPGSASLSFGRQLSADGRYVAFRSEADALLPGEQRSPDGQVFVRDLLTGDVTLVSRSGPAGAPANDDSGEPQISADGRRVLFLTRATNLVEGLSGQQAVLRDLDAGTTVLVSAGPGGVPAAGNVGRPSLSSDGRIAAYDSNADNLGVGPLAVTQVIVRNLVTGTQRVGSATAAGVLGDDDSSSPSLDGDGSRVAFRTTADNLDGDPDDDTGTLIVKDLVDDSVRLVSRDSNGAKLPGGGFEPSIDDNGTKVAFGTSGKLDPKDSDGGGNDVAVRDLAAGTTLRVTRRADGGEPAKPSFVGKLSRDGSFVLFGSGAQDLAADALPPSPFGAIYLAATDGSTVSLVNRRADGAFVSGSNATTADVSEGGRCVAFVGFSRNVFADVPGTTDFSNVLVKAMTGACPVVPASPPGPGPGPGPGPVPGPGPGPGPTADKVAPALTAVSVTNKRFRRTTKATATTALAKAGTTFRFKLSETATVRIVIERGTKGRRVGTRCVKATSKNRKRKACVRYASRGSLTRRALKAGSRTVAFSGRIGRIAIPLGTYRARLVATDPAGNRSAERRVSFTVVRR